MSSKIFIFCALMFCGAMCTSAQTSLVGREYYNANILAQQTDKLVNMPAKERQEAKEEYIADKEKEKGRKLTDKERAEASKEFDQKMDEAVKVMKGMKTSVTIQFTDAAKGVTKMKVTIDENALKNAGVSWVKRKAIKAALAAMPDSEKFDYTVNGDLVIFVDKEETDTFRLSSDGKYLTGKIDKDKVTLTRTK